MRLSARNLAKLILGIEYKKEPVYPKRGEPTRFKSLQKLHLMSVIEPKFDQEDFLFMLCRFIPTLSEVRSDLRPIPIWVKYVLNDTPAYQYNIAEVSFSADIVGRIETSAFRRKFHKLRGLSFSKSIFFDSKVWAYINDIPLNRIHASCEELKNRSRKKRIIMYYFNQKLEQLTHLHLELEVIKVRDMCLVLNKCHSLENFFLELSNIETKFEDNLMEDPFEYEINLSRLRNFKLVLADSNTESKGSYMISHILKNSPNVENIHLECSKTFMKCLLSAFRADYISLQFVSSLTIKLKCLDPCESRGKILELVNFFRNLKFLYVVEDKIVLKDLQKINRHKDITILNKLRDPKMAVTKSGVEIYWFNTSAYKII